MWTVKNLKVGDIIYSRQSWCYYVVVEIISASSIKIKKVIFFRDDGKDSHSEHIIRQGDSLFTLDFIIKSDNKQIAKAANRTLAKYMMCKVLDR